MRCDLWDTTPALRANPKPTMHVPTTRRRWLPAISLAIALALISGCPPKTPGAMSPNDTLNAYAAALSQGRANDAYALLSNEAKRSISLEAFRRMVEDSPEDVRDIAVALSRPGSDPVVTATVVAPDGEKLRLIYEAGAWRVDGTGVDRYGQTTPRQALLGFLRAYKRARWDIIMRYVPNKEIDGTGDESWGGDDTGGLTAEMLKASWTGPEKEEIDATVQAIRAALPTAKLEQTGDRATMAYGNRGTVLFVREGGSWKLEKLR